MTHSVSTQRATARGSGSQEELRDLLLDIRLPVYLRRTPEGWLRARTRAEELEAVSPEGAAGAPVAAGTRREFAYTAPCHPTRLGNAGFLADHRLRLPYLAGAMANGIGSVEIVLEMARHGMLGFFGAAGLPMPAIERAIERVKSELRGEPYGFNLIHSPNEPALENGAVELYLKHGVRLVEASAYLDLTLPLIKYRTRGIRRAPDGRVEAPNRIIAKASRIEVASRFFAPPPDNFLRELVRTGDLSEEQAELARGIPVAQDLTAEADSAGHTDNRPALTLLPTLLALRDRVQRERGYREELRIGGAGGISTPRSALAAFALGADYILTGTVNQACVESGTSDLVRTMLAETEQADVAMAPAADMFEMGVKVQVLKRGTLFAMRAAKLYEIYRRCAGIAEIPKQERAELEKNIFRANLDEIWEHTRRFFLERDEAQVARAEQDSKHKLALVCRWYLGLSSSWANEGVAARKVDFQVWCGPAMGAFNEWTRGTLLEGPANRRVVLVAWNLLYGAAVLARVQALRQQGVELPAETVAVRPRALSELAPFLLE